MFILFMIMSWGSKTLSLLKSARDVINSKYDALRNTQYNLRSVFASTLNHDPIKLYLLPYYRKHEA